MVTAEEPENNQFEEDSEKVEPRALPVGQKV